MRHGATAPSSEMASSTEAVATLRTGVQFVALEAEALPHRGGLSHRSQRATPPTANEVTILKRSPPSRRSRPSTDSPKTSFDVVVALFATLSNVWFPWRSCNVSRSMSKLGRPLSTTLMVLLSTAAPSTWYKPSAIPAPSSRKRSPSLSSDRPSTGFEMQMCQILH